MTESERDEALRLAKEAAVGTKDGLQWLAIGDSLADQLARLIALATAPLKKRIAELEAELAALKQQREGWVLVPKEATQKIGEAASDWSIKALRYGQPLDWFSVTTLWSAMLAAAPSEGEKG